ncbi:hypothetical protein PF010_g32655 [Phytophthora fragariae]|uniref:RxLR effector protein n=1 Tax=Phytophthora fragariae TaxID=53985 RepID=A0A6A3D947_9STRA|nr:hypothetical protein PF003_g32284 [Phytophthora fragariae]KAE8916826.1 hypothetical protein PF009_g32851 [Phytophthora fragariae]KAE9054161.1 hypothetical protein PF010_g32655 [Phytophthora fragariae]KAE9163328.1 hypothetical protein PF004_g30180 [Phytophthora fragariae]KAE9265772.1 hypothetical protein PF001_g30748 [Phytophthora fragariae]
MRFTHLLLVAAVTLLASQDVVASPVAVSVNEKRLLRTHDVAYADNAVEREEERGFTPSAAWIEKWSAKMPQWVENGNYPSLIKKYLGSDAAVQGTKARAKYNLFNAAFLKKHPSGFNHLGQN